MKLTLDNFKQQLNTRIQPIYLISGDEILLREEARTLLRNHAYTSGYKEKILLQGDTSFKWAELECHLFSTSLFADKQYIELNWHKGSFPKDASAVLKYYCSKIDHQKLLCITTPKLEASVNKTQWFKQLSQIAGILTIWPIAHRQLPGWIRQRMQSLGLTPIEQSEMLMAELSEGNLLSAQQTIEKLSLQHRLAGTPQNTLTPISNKLILDAIECSAEYNIFDWVNYLLIGQAGKSLHIYDRLIQSGTEATLLLWAIAKDIRLLLKLKPHHNNPQFSTQFFTEQRIWKQKQGQLLKASRRLSTTTLTQALRLCHQIDKAIKGASTNNPELLFQQLTELMCQSLSTHTP